MTDNPSPPLRAYPLIRSVRDPGVAAIPQNIAALAGFHGMPESLVAQRAGISESSWARRKVRPELWTLAELRRVAELLGVEVGRLTQVGEP